MRKILVTGALGQIGTELVPLLRARYGNEAVVATDIRVPARGLEGAGPFEEVDCTSQRQIESVVRRHEVGTVYHLAALLSAVAEHKPRSAWDVNMGGVYRVLEVARTHELAVFVPSSIGAFGPTTPQEHTPQDTVQRPTTMYGITKVAGELLCDYATRFGLDTRGLRFPGLISYTAPPGGGTTDYAVDIFHEALRYRHYTCYLAPNTPLPMMYLPDALRAMVELMEADEAKLVHRNAFNIHAMTFTPAELGDAIAERVPGFVIDYDVDPVRQAIAESWPHDLDDSAARDEWGWAPEYDLGRMCDDMIDQLGRRVRPAG